MVTTTLQVKETAIAAAAITAMPALQKNSRRLPLIAQWQVIDGKLICHWIVD